MLLVGINCQFSILFAGDQEKTKDFYELDLWEMRQISVVSKKEELIQDAPGIITVISADEISRFGARNLRDILDRLPNMQVRGSSGFPNGRTVLRGIDSGERDDSILFLIDGMPVRDTGTGGHNTDLYMVLPVEMIDRVEVIRGPGSVLYGPNALAGIINIKTKRFTNNDKTTASVAYGSFDHRQLSLSGGTEKEEFWFSGSVTGLDNNGDEFTLFEAPRPGPPPRPGEFRTGTSGYGALFSAGYKNLKINGLFTNARALTDFTPSKTRDIGRQQLTLQYQTSPSKRWNATITFTPSRAIQDIPGNHVQRNIGHLVELTTFGKLTDTMNLVLGSAYEWTETRFPTGDKRDNWWSEIYGQLDIQPTSRTKLIAGFQINKIRNIQQDISPRAGLIVDIAQHWTAKFLYGEAFRPARSLDNNVNRSVRARPLRPEITKTYDAQLAYSGPNIESSFTVYHTRQIDIHTTQTIPGGPTFFVNRGKVKYDGVEWEGKYKLNNRLFFLGNISFQTNEDDMGTEEVTRVPNWQVKTGISYASPRGFKLSLFNSYISETKPAEEIDAIPHITVNEKAEQYSLLTLNVELNLGLVINKPSLENVKLSIYGDNLLDVDAFSPDSPLELNFPIHSGRSVYATLAVSF